MLQLAWIENQPSDGEGHKLHMHYLVDHISQRCFATITEPRFGGLLYVTDIRVAGVDRSYVSLEPAKSYCEGVALEDDMECAKRTKDLLPKEVEIEVVKEPA
jgi:hypothetical protein